MNKTEQRMSEWMMNEPKVHQATSTLVALLRAAQGSIMDEDQNDFTYVFELTNDSEPELNGRYKISIEVLED